MKRLRGLIILIAVIGVIILALFLRPKPAERHGDTSRILAEGDAFFREEKIDQALLKYREVLEKTPKLARAHVGVARCYARMGKIDEAILESQEAIADDRNDHEAHYHLATLFFNNYRYDEALQEAAIAVRLSPKNPEYRSFAAQMYDRAKMYGRAIEEWEKVLAMDSRKASFLVPLAGAYYRNGDIKKALELLGEAARTEPESQFGRIAAGLSQDLEKKHAKDLRLKDLQREIKFQTQNPALYFEMGGIYFEQEKYPEAEDCLKKALRLDAAGAASYILMAKILDKSNKKAEAVRNLEQAVKLQPKDHSLYVSLAGLYYQIGRLTEAQACLRKVIALVPGSEDALFAQKKLEDMRKAFPKESK